MATVTVVFLHGLGATHAMWDPHVAAMPEYRCIVPDLPAHGSAADRPWDTLSGTAAEIASLVEATPERRAHLVGLSLGGALALHLLRTRPELFDRVIIDGAAAYSRPFEGAVRTGVAAISPFMHRQIVMRRIADTLGMGPDSYEAFARDFSRIDARSVRRIVQNVLGARLPNAPKIENDVLLVAGEWDLWGVRSSNATLATQLPNGSAWIAPEHRHGWANVNPALHVAMTKAFLVGLPLPMGLMPETVAPARGFVRRRSASEVPSYRP